MRKTFAVAAVAVIMGACSEGPFEPTLAPQFASITSGVTATVSGTSVTVAWTSGGLNDRYLVKLEGGSATVSANLHETAFPAGAASHTFSNLASGTYEPCMKNTGQGTQWQCGASIVVASTPVVVIPTSDNTPPVIASSVSGTIGLDGWYTSNVTVSWSVTDPDSPVTSQTGCAAVEVTEDADGQIITCTASSAGGTSSQSVTIKRDATLPTVTYGNNASTYTVDQMVAITCAANDATPGSGLASTTCQDISGAAYTFVIGANSHSAEAVDNAGQSGSGATTFTVSVTGASVCELVKRWVAQHGVAKSMCSQLQNGAFGAFRNHVRSQSGKSVSATNATILIALSNHL